MSKEKVSSFDKAKNERDGVITAEDVLQEMLNHVDDIESIVIITEHKEGQIKTHCSCDSGLKAVGMAEAGKEALFMSMYG